MGGFSTNSTEHLIRTQLWSSQLKDVLQDELYGMRFIDWITDFPDGDTLNIPSIGEAETYDYGEGQAIKYTAMDTGNFTFTITDYKASATYVTNKMKQDSFYMSRIIPMFVPKQHRALMTVIESDVFAIGPLGQTASNSNTINNAKHRFVASGVNGQLTIEDFAKALFALKKANVPPTNLVAIVDPSVEVYFNTLTNIVNVSNNPRWEGLISTGMSTGMQFRYNILGFDVYTSNYLKTGMTETIDGVTVTTNGTANLFFSAASDVLPFVGSLRQPPKVDSEYNKDLQRDEYVTTCRYGFKLFRPENLVVILSDSGQVYT